MKRITKLLSILLIFVMLLPALGALTVSAQEPTVFQECTDLYFRGELAKQENGEALLYFYDKLRSEIESFGTRFYYSDESYSISFDEAKSILFAFLDENAQYYWLSYNRYSWNYDSQNRPYFELFFQFSPEELSSARDRFETSIMDFYDGLDPSMTELDMVLFLHDKLATKVRYTESTYSGAYTAIVDHTAVCEEYTRAFQTLLYRVGIPSIFVRSIESDNHAWNLVKIDGKWYHIDVTWDDQSWGVSKDYFGLTDEMIAAVDNHHIYMEEYSYGLPAADATDAYYKNIKTVTLGIVPSYCCEDFKSLRNVTILSNVTSLGDFAFYGCTALKSITIPASVLSIGSYAVGYYTDEFYNCITKQSGFKIYGYADTAAQSYAEENGFRFVDLGAACQTGHTWNEGVMINAATCTESGTMVYTCTVCGNTKSESTPPLGHDFDKGVCTRCGYEAVSASEVFSDIKSGAYYDQAVLWAIRNGITSGTGNGKFSPKQPCTREQVVTFLYAANGRPEIGAGTNPFTDVKAGKWYYDAVMWAVQAGVTGGMSDTVFGIGTTCTRAQTVTFLYALAGRPPVEDVENPFEDVPEGKWFHDAVLWAYANGITGGTTPTTFSPNATCTRAQVVTFLYAAYGD